MEPDRRQAGAGSGREGGYLWQGELRLWDNEILMGWYAASDGSVRSKGTMYFVMHPHGIHATGRWVGLGYDGNIVTGWSSMAKSEEEARKLVGELKEQDASGDEVCEVIITAPDPDWLVEFSRRLVTDRLCASGHNFQPIQTIYRWQGEIHDTIEGPSCPAHPAQPAPPDRGSR